MQSSNIIINIHQYGTMNVSTDSYECHRCPTHYSSNDNRDKCFPTPEEYLAFSDILTIRLISLILLGLMINLILGSLLYYQWNKPNFEVVEIKLEIFLLVALSSTLLSSLSFFGRPNEVSCHFREPVTCLCLAVVFSYYAGKIFCTIWSFQGRVVPIINLLNIELLALSAAPPWASVEKNLAARGYGCLNSFW